MTALLDPYWFEGTTPLWMLVVISYWFGALYLKAFDDHDHDWYVWLSFLVVGTGIFIFVNRAHLWGEASSVTTPVEVVAIAAIFLGGVVLFILAREYAQLREQYRRRETQIEQYRDLMKYYDTNDIEDDD